MKRPDKNELIPKYTEQTYLVALESYVDFLEEQTKDSVKELSRFFVDLRGGCGAVRDRQHPNFNPDYKGLHHDTIDVVEYKHGFQNHAANCWDMMQEDINFLNEKCNELNQ